MIPGQKLEYFTFYILFILQILSLFRYKYFLLYRFQTVFNKMHFPISAVLWQESQRLENSLNCGQHLMEYCVRSQMNMGFFCTGYDAQSGSTRGNVGTPQQWRRAYWVWRFSFPKDTRKSGVISNGCKQWRLNQIRNGKINFSLAWF